MCGGSSRPQVTNTTTEYPEWLRQPMENNIGIANQLADQMMQQGYQSYGGQRIADFNPYQSRAIENIGASQGAWSPFLQSASDTLGSSNQLVTSAMQNATQNAMIDPAYAGPAAMAGIQSVGTAQAGIAQGGPGATVNTQNLSGTNLSGYMNPYTDMVTQSTLGNIEKARQMQNLTNSDAATRAKAFGGSRHGVVEAQTNAGFAKQAADTALQAAQGNFANAQQQAQTDLARQLQAGLANQGSANNMSQFNASMLNQGNQFNANALNQGGQFNAGLAAQTGQFNAGAANDMAQYNAGLAQQGAMFNAQNANNVAGTQLAGAAQLNQNAQGAGQLGSLYQQLYANDNNNLMTAGNMMQDQTQAGLDMQYQEWLNAQNHPFAALALRQAAVSGTPYQPGQSTSTPLYRNRTSGFLGGAASAYGATQNPWLAAIGGLFGAYG